MITKEMLDNNRQYKINNKEKLNYGSEPKPMFIDGKFNPINWNGGDNLIRQFFYNMECSDWQKYYEIDFNDESYDLFANLLYNENQYYGNIIIHGDEIKTYTFGWYKHRGCTEYAGCGDRYMTEEEYLEVLNLLSQVYNFEI